MNIPGRRIMANDDIVTAPFGRGGDGMFLRAELIEIDQSVDVTIKVFTRNTEDDWPALNTTPLGTLTIGSTPGVFQLHLPTSTGIKEELRLYIQRSTGSGWSIIRVLPPLFYDGAVA
jgi:hypothetical protein